MTKILIILSLILTSTPTYANDCPPDKIGSFCDSKFVVSNQTLRDLVNGETILSKSGDVVVNSYADYIIDTRYVTDMSGLFKNTNPEYSIRHWNTDNVINCYLFAEYLKNNHKPDFKAC